MRSFFIIALVLLLILSLPAIIIFGFDLVGKGADINEWLENTFNISHRIALTIPAAIVMFCIPIMIILLYFLRLKRNAIEVPSTFLWKKSIEDLHVNRLMQWLRRNVLLLLQLLMMLFLIYAALGPRTHGAVSGGRYYILIIDNSASMTATDVKPTRLEWAKSEALKTIDAATDTDSGMLVVFNSTAEIRQSYTTSRDELRAAVRAIQPTHNPTRIDEALSLAASRANPDRSTANESVTPQNIEPGKERTYVQTEGLKADLHLFSDGRFPAVPDFALANLNMTYHTPPAEEATFSKNVGIIRCFAERDAKVPTNIIARIGVRSFKGQRDENVKVKLDVRDASDRLVAGYAKSIVLGIPPDKQFAEGEIEFTIPDVGENANLVLKATIDQAGDIFADDDSASIVLGQLRKARVLVVSLGNRVLRNYFDTDAAKKIADFVYIKPDDWNNSSDKDVSAAREGKFDLVIFDRCGPKLETDMPAANTFFIGYPPPPYHRTPVGENDPNAVIDVKGPAVRGWQIRHPIMANLRALDEIPIADAFRLPFLPPRTPRLLEGDRDLVLLAALPRQYFTDLVLTFPLVMANADGPDRVWNSYWPLRPSFVLFLRNVLMNFGDVRETATEDSISPGSIKSMRLRTAKEATLTKPNGSTSKLIRGSRAEFSITETDQLGVYQVEYEDQSRRFAVNLFDPLESDLAPANSVTIGSEVISADDPRKTPLELWKWFVVGGLIVVLVEWWIYNRRVQI